MSQTVAVTGAAGFVAGELIHQLLERGYTVRGTVRSIERAKELLAAFPSLQLFEADLLKEGSFDECFKGVDYVFHTASPFLNQWNDPQTDLVDPALLGTKNVCSVLSYPDLQVLSSVEKNLDTIKKVVVTSSGAAIVSQNPPEDSTLVFQTILTLQEEKVWSEEDWNTTSSLTEGPYRYSKYLAEKAAWDWWKGKEDKVKLLTVNPCFVLGVPRHKRNDGTSIETVVNLLNGVSREKGCGAACFGIADNRTVAQTHIACIENDEASGRHLVTSPVAVSFLEYANILKKHFPNYPLPEKQNGEVTYVPKYSQEKVRKLGIQFHSVEDTLVWMAKGLIDMGYIPEPENQ